MQVSKTKTQKPEDEWKCSACTRVNQSIPMIGCDSCDQWFHWSCVGIVVEPRPEDVWICSDCRRVKPLKKKRKEGISKESYSSTPSSTRPLAGKKGPKIKTGSGLVVQTAKTSSTPSVSKKNVPNPTSIASSSSKASSTYKSSSVTKHSYIANNPMTSSGIVSSFTEPSSQGWMCAYCKVW